jgi:hypothetical protein
MAVDESLADDVDGTSTSRARLTGCTSASQPSHDHDEPGRNRGVSHTSHEQILRRV